jgi:glycosyltransferase involved in cell wall biosynthesis
VGLRSRGRCRRVLYLNPTADLYGASSCLLNVLRSLDRSRFGAAVVLPMHGPLEARLSELGVPCFVVPGLTVLRRGLLRPVGLAALAASLLPAARRVARIARAIEVDLIHTNSSVVLSGALAARLAHRPHVWHVREITADQPLLWRWFGPLMLHTSERVVCVSKATAAQFEPFRAGSRVRVIYDGLDRGRVRSSLDAAQARATFGLSPEAIVVGSMGYLNPRKGADVLIEAVARVKAHFEGPVRLLIAGAPFPGNEAYLAELHRQVQALGVSEEVRFAGFVDDVAAFLAALDVFAFAARAPEGFGMAVAEAMAAGVPVIATRLGGILEVVEDGQSGLLVLPGSVGALAAALLRLLRDPAERARLSANGRAEAAQRLNLRCAVAALESLYLEL